jgi:Uncharacterized conserved protein
MAVMEPSAVPPGRDHLDPEEVALLAAMECHLAAGDHRAAQDCAEDLWRLATDAHKRLYQGLSNALTAVCARELGHLRGAREIAARTHEMLRPYPRRVLGLDLETLLATMDRFVATGGGPVLAGPGNDA